MQKTVCDIDLVKQKCYNQDKIYSSQRTNNLRYLRIVDICHISKYSHRFIDLGIEKCQHL